jgi:hypothetical protein
LKNFFNKIFGISQRSTGTIDEDGRVIDIDIFSYNMVSDPGFSNATFSEINELHWRIQKELARQELLKTRKEKLDRLNEINTK